MLQIPSPSPLHFVVWVVCAVVEKVVFVVAVLLVEVFEFEGLVAFGEVVVVGVVGVAVVVAEVEIVVVGKKGQREQEWQDAFV